MDIKSLGLKTIGIIVDPFVPRLVRGTKEDSNCRKKGD
jgi:hypothetical protein